MGFYFKKIVFSKAYLKSFLLILKHSGEAYINYQTYFFYYISLQIYDKIIAANSPSLKKRTAQMSKIKGGGVEAPFGQCPKIRRFFMASLTQTQ